MWGDNVSRLISIRIIIHWTYSASASLTMFPTARSSIRVPVSYPKYNTTVSATSSNPPPKLHRLTLFPFMNIAWVWSTLSTSTFAKQSWQQRWVRPMLIWNQAPPVDEGRLGPWQPFPWLTKDEAKKNAACSWTLTHYTDVIDGYWGWLYLQGSTVTKCCACKS